MKRTFSLLMLIVILGLMTAGCAAADVVLKYAPGSLEEVVGADPDLVTEPNETDPYFTLTVDQETALEVSRDYSLTGDGDIVIRTPLRPFTDAGLDIAKLGEGYRAQDGELLLLAGYGDGTGRKDTFTESVLESVAYDRSVLSYHQALDHYGVKLPGGKFEWAKDARNNDKDVVFVLAAKPFADIGVDVRNIDGWAFLTMKDEKNNDIDVLVKPYDLQ